MRCGPLGVAAPASGVSVVWGLCSPADVFHLFHYWDKTCGKTRLVDTTRERLEAVLLKDYLLYPGAEWSKLVRGTAVLVVGKAPVGNMYCVKTMRSVVCTEVGVDWG